MLDYTLRFAHTLLGVDSPTGYTHDAVALCAQTAQDMGYKVEYTEKGNLHIHIEGKSDKTIGVCAHVDTLGLMVRSIKADGTLAFTNLGGPIIPTLDGEYCRVITRDQKVYTGTILSNSAAAHVHPDASTLARTCDTMNVRLDEVVRNADDVKKLGIMNGDYIAIDPKTSVTSTGFIKSRFLDDKLSVAIIFAVLNQLKQTQTKPQHNVAIILSTYEEVGHGSSYIPTNISELLAVDMGCIGLDLACSEYDVSICAKDSSGPYDHAMTSHLVSLAKKHALGYAVDIYPQYGSDVSAALRGGHNIKGALIGPGVHASHGMERSHSDAIKNTAQLLMAYLCE